MFSSAVPESECSTHPSSLYAASAIPQIIEYNRRCNAACTHTHTRANNCLFSAPKGQGNVTSQGPKIIARSFSMVTKENTLRVNYTSPLDLLTDGLLNYYVYRLKLTQVHDIDLNIENNKLSLLITVRVSDLSVS